MAIVRKIIERNRLQGRPIIIAGPCSIESEEQALATAKGVAEAGADMFRGGVWKPRTKPGSFEGLGEKALEILLEVRKKTGLPVTTEVATAAHARLASEAQVDAIWIGARTTANPFAVQEIASELAAAGYKGDFLIKNPVSVDLELWIGAVERFRLLGFSDIAAVHRGFSSYGNNVYRNPPHWYIPFEFRRRMPGIPVIHDPSHTAGRRDLVARLCRRAMDMRFDGIMLESHCNPEAALTDAAQQITPQELAGIVASLRIRRETTDPGIARLNELRSQIDDIDEELVELLGKRLKVCREIGELKRAEGMSVVQNDRYSEMLGKRISQAEGSGMSEDFLRSVWEKIHAESVRQQLDITDPRK